MYDFVGKNIWSIPGKKFIRRIICFEPFCKNIARKMGMKYCWRITKYDPKKRNSQGWFIEDTWTSRSEVGSLYQGEKLTYDEYIRVENLYIDAIVQFMKGLNVSCLQVKSLENHDRINEDPSVDKAEVMFVNTLKENDLLSLEQVKVVSKLILREYFWCKLISKYKMFVDFGYDYYMYIGSRLECKDILQRIRESGLYVEDFESPYK
jgi:hypothetical protein